MRLEISMRNLPNDMHHRLASEIARVEKKYPNPSVGTGTLSPCLIISATSCRKEVR